MKHSLISASSILALLSAAVGPADAAPLTVMPGQFNIYDLVHDGATSSDGGDSTVSMQDPVVSAVAALEAAIANWLEVSFTGPVDTSAAAGLAFPRIPLGAAPGARQDNDFATPVAGAWQWNARQKSQAMGADRIAPLVGTIGGASEYDKAGSTVFVAAGSQTGFSDRGYNAGGRGNSPALPGFSASSSNTATITVMGGGNFRQRAGPGFAAAASGSAPVVPSVAKTVAQPESGQPALGYSYAPAASPAAKANAVEAAFSNAVTATGQFNAATKTAVSKPVAVKIANGRSPDRGKVQTFDRDQSGPLGDGDVALFYRRLIEGSAGKTRGGDFVSASVSATPSATAARYVAQALNSVNLIAADSNVEAFQIGPASESRTRNGKGTLVSNPLHDKIVAGAGALNNSLALP
jgi:hypothetical protein